MIPSHRKHLLGVLENTLLNSLPSSDTNIIWTDSGVAGTKMNPRYQMRCKRALPHASPRAKHLDEILWNLPVVPKTLGWTTPERVDTRIIVQDTPTTAEPESEMIHIPHLKEWAGKFRGESNRGTDLTPSEVPLKRHRIPMYGLAFSTSSVTSQSWIVSEEKSNCWSDCAMTLVPDVNRARFDEGYSFVGESHSHWQIRTSPIYHQSANSALTDRISLNASYSTPLPNRSKERIYPVEKITRCREYGRIPHPSHYTGDWTAVSRRSPVFHSEKQDIDTLESRKQEVRRLLSAVRFLMSKVPVYDDMHNCCRKIESICEGSLSKTSSSDSLLDTLREVRRIICNNEHRANTWQLLYNERENLLQKLKHTNQVALQRVQTNHEDILYLYGNSLFLAVFVVADYILGNCTSPWVVNLWDIIAEWELYQIGFRSEKSDDTFYSKYDFQAIYANLISRAKELTNIPKSETPQYSQLAGQLIQRETSDGIDSWLVFPRSPSGEMIAGYAERAHFFRQGWYRCVINPETLSECAEDIVKSGNWDRFPIVVTQIEGQNVLFVNLLYDGEMVWRCLGVLEYGRPPKGKNFPVRWIRISEPPPELYLALHGYTPHEQVESSSMTNSLLDEIARWNGIVIPVSCHVGIDKTKRVYRLDLRKKPNSEVLLSKEMIYTKDVIEFLRFPFIFGKYISNHDGNLLKWNPRKDVEYIEFMIEDTGSNKEWLSLTFLKPLVHRYSFYPRSFIIPATCDELLRTRVAGSSTLRVSIDESLRGVGAKKYLKVNFEGIKSNERIREFEHDVFGIFDVALLAECKQIFNLEKGTRYNLEINVEGLESLKLPHNLSEYPELYDNIVAMREDLEGDSYL